MKLRVVITYERLINTHRVNIIFSSTSCIFYEREKVNKLEAFWCSLSAQPENETEFILIILEHILSVRIQIDIL